jgi:hypothetical protein
MDCIKDATNNDNDTIHDLVGQSASSNVTNNADDVVTRKQQKLLLSDQLMQTKTQQDNHTVSDVTQTQTKIFTYSSPTLILMPHFQILKSGNGLY